MKSSKLKYIGDSIKLNIKPLLKMLVVYLIVIIGMESLFRKSLIETVFWVFNEPFLFMLNIFSLVMISAFLLLFTKRIDWVTIIVGGLTAILSLVNIGKFELRNVPLLYEDFFLISEVWVLMPEIMNVRILLIMAIGTLLAVFCGFLLVKWFKQGRLQKHRTAMIALLLLSVSVFSIGQNINSADLSINKSGFIYSLSNNTRAQMIIHEEQLQEAKVLYEQYLDAYLQLKDVEKLTERPNIIIIQSEAFWDINKLGVKFNKNPIPIFDALKKESVYGEAYVPVFGGGTSNPEYEILTGLTMKNFSNDWYMVYPNEIKSPAVTLASILRKQGYYSEGIHPYMSWYYNRLEVYEHFGFNSFRTVEFMNQYEKIGVFASDDFTTDLIIDSIEQNKAPVFNFVVTMQNHGPYGNSRFTSDAFDIEIETKLTDSSRYLLANYTQGLHLSDRALGKLVDYLRTSDEPTILLFFGDHLPMLGEDYQIYREVGYIGNESNEVLQKDMRIMAVPYLIWRNFSDASEEMPTMNLSYLTSILLREAEIEMPEYMKVLYMLRADMPLYLRGVGYDVNGHEITSDMPLYQNTQALFFKLYQNALKEDAWKIIKNKDYNKAYTQIEITSAKEQGDQTVVRGNNLYESMTVFLNDKEVAFDFISTSEIQLATKVVKGDYIVIKLLDSKGKLLATSNKYTMN
ncbi:MAG TPA: hypothetical protein DCS67_09795 [Clostridiales bacterium UBA8960]|nr:hypothetical protein [Clostridiales bacterium UBA8960]